MLRYDLTPLAKRLKCEPEVAAYTGPFIGWRFLAEMLREMPMRDAETKAVVDPVIAGMDRLARGEDWPEAEDARAQTAAWAARAAWAAWAAAWTAAAAEAAWAEEAAWAAAEWANDAGLPYARQREILMRLMEEATDAERTDR